MPKLNLPIGLNYDMTYKPDARHSMSEFHRAALDQIEFIDPYADKVRINEHHGCHTAWTSSPIVIASAMAARSKSIRLEPLVAAPFYHPIRLAEDLAVLDQLSDGRAQVVLAPAYRSEEFEMYGTDLKQRRKIVDTAVHVLRTAWKGEPFELDGRQCLINPVPVQENGLRISLAGSDPSARAAAKYADAFEPLGMFGWDTYVAECEKLGKTKPVWPNEIHIVGISEDPAKARENIWPALEYWMDAIMLWAGKSEAAKDVDTEEKRKNYKWFRNTENENLVVTPERAIELLTNAGENAYLKLYGMWGGSDIDLTTKTLELLVDKVLPHIPESVGKNAMRAATRI